MSILLIVLKWIAANWKLVLFAVIAVAAVSWFSHARYAAGERHGRQAVQNDWDAENTRELREATEAAEQAATTERENARVAKEIQDAIQEKLDAASADARSLSERVRYYQSKRCPRPVPQVAGAPAQPDPASGVPEDGGAVGEATDAHYAACARDATRLGQWQVWYKGLPDQN
jgi:hypothetical protein